MTKSEILRLFDDDQYQLAKLLGITRQAVEQWPMDRDIPEKQYLKLRYELIPQAFRRDGSLKQVRT
jgi:DNA-binding XRE family transcriptional regulator